ncbi:MAG: SDR family NAD(P)-dependent oxidoreductase, partial [Nitrososphaerales archaeon]
PAIAGYNRGAPYTIAKAGILGIVKHVAHEYGRYNIRTYALALGNIRTPKTYDHLTREQKLELAKETPMRRWGSPKEVAGTALILASDHASFVTGQTIVVDGGTVMR